MARKRAVQLTPAGHQRLHEALDAYWQEVQPSVRPTREAHAECFGLSVVTTQKLLTGRPVDRATVRMAFQRLGVEWDDAYCARVEEDVPSPIKLEETPETRPKKRTVLALACAALPIAFLVLLGQRNSTVVEPWRYELDRLIATGTDHFQRGRYDKAERDFLTALQISTNQDLAGSTAESTRMLGDIAAAQGNLALARSRYNDALEIRRANLKLFTGEEANRQRQTIPPLEEALGVVEAQMGRYQEAEQHLRLALEGYRTFAVPSGMSMAYRGLGTNAYQRGKLEAARRYFSLALRVLDRKDAHSDLAVDIRARDAVVRGAQGEKREALAVLNHCLRHWRAKDHPRWIDTTVAQMTRVMQSPRSGGMP
ncbi:MAG TPA: tetratricopeptide repeat protein [Fimbriimonadaceae bacterium]|nr:tetratricopeptide repeat protein [Fimbriimonadaceae bacterium]